MKSIWAMMFRLAVIEDRNGETIDGEETIRRYAEHCAKKGSVYWNASSLTKGMSAKQEKFYRNLVEQGYDVPVYFVVRNERYANEFAYRGTLLSINSSPVPTFCPDPERIPDCFGKEDACVWIGIKELKREGRARAEDYLIASTGRDLRWALDHSQYKFGYLIEK